MTDITLSLPADLKAGTYKFTMAAAALVPLMLNLSEDAYQGDAIAGIMLDGVALPDVTVTAIHGKTVQAVPLGNVDPTVAHKILVTFRNDAYGGTAATDRNLYVDGYQLGTAAPVATPDALMSTGSSFTVNVPVA